MRRQGLRGALRAVRLGRLRLTAGLDGCPAGAWPETMQAMRRMRELLPLESLRSYSVRQFVEAVYETDDAGRLRVRQEFREVEV